MSQTSSDSTTLSEFVRARLTGNIPVFGGDVRTGARQFGAAMSGSTKQVDVFGTIDLLSTQLRSMVGGVAKPSYSGMTNISMLDNSGEELAEAFYLDDDKVRCLLSASAVDPRDIARYLELIRIAQDGLRKKRAAMELHALRKKARTVHNTSLPFDQLDSLVTIDVEGLLRLFGHTLANPSNKKLFVMAMTHESLTEGRETNRVLAYLGDAIARVMLARQAVATGVSVAELSEMVTSSQTNMAWRDAGLNLGLDRFLQCKPPADPRNMGMLSTAFEAMLGAIYIDAGVPALVACNKHIHWYDDGSTPRLASDRYVDASEELG